MKKYFLAGVVAMVAFAMAAFAASLTVQADTLQAGDDNDLECMSEANVAAWGYNDTNDTILEYVDIVTVGEDCQDDEVMHLILLNDSDSQLARGDSTNNAAKLYATLGSPESFVPGQTPRYRFTFSNVNVEDVQGVRIGVDQGHTDYSY